MEQRGSVWIWYRLDRKEQDFGVCFMGKYDCELCWGFNFHAVAMYWEDIPVVS